MEKRGLSSIVSVILIVLLAIVAIAIIWVYFGRPITESSSSAARSGQEVILSQSRFSIVPQTINFNKTTGNLTFVLKKVSGSGEISGVKLSFRDKNGVTKTVTRNLSMEVGEAWIISISKAEYGLDDIDSVEVYPYIASGNYDIISASSSSSVGNLNISTNSTGLPGGSSCNNGSIETGEICDVNGTNKLFRNSSGSIINTDSCSAYNSSFASGVVSCSGDCLSIGTNNCSLPQINLCLGVANNTQVSGCNGTNYCINEVCMNPCAGKNEGDFCMSGWYCIGGICQSESALGYVPLNGCKGSGWIGGKTYKLVSDLYTTGNCFMIDSSSVIFDGQMHTITSNQSGQLIRLGSYNNSEIIKNFVLKNVSYGIYFMQGRYNLITNITVIGGSAYSRGIFVDSSQDNVISGCNINSVGYGIQLVSNFGPGNALIGNVITNNANGLFTVSGTPTNLTSNLICNNSEYDIKCSGSQFTANNNMFTSNNTCPSTILNGRILCP